MPRDASATLHRVLDRHAGAAAFPLGGIGTGTVSLGARGDLRDWELVNKPDKGSRQPFSFFAIRAANPDRAPVTRILESRLPTPHGGDQGYDVGRLAGLPRLRESRMRGEYPMLWIEFEDPDLPVEVGLCAFTPLVPLDSEASGIPGCVLRYSVTNTGEEPVAVSVVGTLANCVGATTSAFPFPTYTGQPRNAWRDEDLVKGLFLSSDLDARHLLAGSVALTTSDPSVTAKPQWLTGQWHDGAQRFWDDLCADGLLDPEPVQTLDTTLPTDAYRAMRVGSLGIVHELAPGEVQDFEFVLSWHFPNRPRAWQGNVGLDDTHVDEVVRNHYATAYADAWDVARHLHTRLPRLEAQTRRFHSAMFAGTLPREVVDAATSTLTALRSTTCLRLEGGTFAAWEGSFDHSGSCEGTCTHVWNYAQSVAHLFPDLERDARRTEFLHETAPDGRMNFRANSVFGNLPWDFVPAVDGQLGAVLRLHREWRFCGDDDFLRELWPAARPALEFSRTRWDLDGDDVLEGEHHTTYDLEFVGATSLAGSLFCAALLAGGVMAAHLGEQEAADHFVAMARRSARRMDAMLFNGDYYEQGPAPGEDRRYQYGSGCLSDQVFGQLLAHITGLGDVLPREHVHSALRAVYAANFRPDLSGHASVQRTYALGDEGGLLLCSWPRGARPVLPFPYADEIWTGVEYQVATHLVYAGMIGEALTIVRAVRDRHDGVRRNPWNEVECGNHYARSLASWGLVLALTGAQYDGPRRRLLLAPHAVTVDGDARCRTPFTTGTGWGELLLAGSEDALLVHGGFLELDELVVRRPTGGDIVRRAVSLVAGDVLALTGDEAG